MYKINKILIAAIVIIVSVIYILLPSISMDSMMHGTQSGKTFTFLFIAIILSIALYLQYLFFNRARHFPINIMDIVLLIWCMYTFLNNYLQKIPPSLRLFELYGLFILYIFLRLTQRKYQIWFYFALTIGGIIQAVHGNLQLWGFYPSHHELFKMTGSFFNPGPYAGFLASAFPVSLSLFLFTSSNNAADQPVLFKRLVRYFDIKSLPLISIICICLTLPASHSRAAWLAVMISSFYLFSIKFKLYHRIMTYFSTRGKKLLLLFSLLILISVTVTGLYHLKKDSVNGRMLIWKISLNMIMDKPVFGYGYDQFKAHYMDYQAAYFGKKQDSEEAMVAGDTNYAFNEFLQHIAENGVSAFVIIASLLIIIFISKGSSVSGTGSELQKRDFQYIAAKAGLISILVFSLFSYPSQILPIKTNMTLFLATLSGHYYQKNDFLHISSIWRNAQRFSRSLKIIIPVALLLMVYPGIKLFNGFLKAYRLWNEADQVYKMGAYKESLEEFEKAWLRLKSNGDFLTDYGKALSMAGEHHRAIEISLQAAKYYPNVVVYTTLGDSYKQLGKVQHAEQAYLHAWYMNPSRFYPKYLLAKLYEEAGQKGKAVSTATELMQMQIKVPSTAIEEIKEEMQKIILRNKSIN